jgi:hypothetical protein
MTQAIEIGQKFTTEVDGIVRNFRIIKVTANRVTVINEAGNSYRVNVNMSHCRAFSHRQVQENINSGYWKF